MKFIEKLYSELLKDGEIELSNPTSPCFMFNMNLGRALVLPTLRYGPESDVDWASIDTQFLYQASITQIITSLETYYYMIFNEITKKIKISKIKAKALSTFIIKNKLTDEYFGAIAKNNRIDFYISDIIPDTFSLQNGDKIKLSLGLIDIDPIGRYEPEWNRTFGKKKDSTVMLRHQFVHEGISLALGKYNDDFILERIKDSIKLTNNVDIQVQRKYPFMKLPDLSYR